MEFLIGGEIVAYAEGELAEGAGNINDVVGVGGNTNTTASTGTASGATAPVGTTGALVTTFLPFIVVAVLFYFMLIKPQKKQEKETKKMLESMRVGDKVVSIGGICGKIVKLKDSYVYVETGNIGTPGEKSVIKFEKSAIKAVETKHDDE